MENEHYLGIRDQHALRDLTVIFRVDDGGLWFIATQGHDYAVNVLRPKMVRRY